MTLINHPFALDFLSREEKRESEFNEWFETEVLIQAVIPSAR